MNEACDLASLARPRWRFYLISPRQQRKLIYPPQFRSRHFLRLSHPPLRLDGRAELFRSVLVRGAIESWKGFAKRLSFLPANFVEID
jgi:hypothetical protein